MSLQIDQVLAQIRALSAQAGARITPPAVPRADAVATGQSQPADFGKLLKAGIDAVNQRQQSANALEAAWERGDPGVSLARVMIKTEEAAVSFQGLTEARNRLVTAYQTIMNMST